jgi:hypothetical protein
VLGVGCAVREMCAGGGRKKEGILLLACCISRLCRQPAFYVELSRNITWA